MFHVGILYRIGSMLEFLLGRNIGEDAFVRDFDRWLGASGRHILEAAYSGGWLEKSADGSLRVTDSGVRLLDEETPSGRLRLEVKKLVETARPAWASLAVKGRRAVVTYAPPEAVQCLMEAGLLDGTDSDTVDWWDAIVAVVRKQRNEKATHTGRIGEQLSIQYEENRTGAKPEWVALETPDSGFDVLSIVSSTCDDRLIIEVKTSTLDWDGASLFLSRNEWDVLGATTHSCLHLWSIAGHTRRFAAVDIADVAPHVPVDQGNGRWREVTVSFVALAHTPIEPEI